MKCKKLFVKILSVVLATTVFAPTATIFRSVPVMAASESQDMYRLYNSNSGEHFYTSSAGERDSLIRTGWNYEGIGWRAPKSGKPVYRLYNPNVGDHHYTMNSNERDSLIKAGWRYEKVGWYSGGSVPLYRQYNPNARTGTHNYTTSRSENDSLVRAGWRAENIGWYGVGGGASADANIDYSVYNNALTDAMADARQQWLSDDVREVTYSGQYMYYDMTGDGVKELILDFYSYTGTYSRLYIYTIRNGEPVRLYGDYFSWSDVLGANGRSIIICEQARMSDPYYSRIYWTGSRMVSESLPSEPAYNKMQTYELS